MYAQKMDRKDPEYLIKQGVINSINYLHDQTRQDKDRLYSKIYFAISLVLTLIASFFIDDSKGIAILILVYILIIFLIISWYDYYEKRRIFWINRKKMKETSDNLGLEWKD